MKLHHSFLISLWLNFSYAVENPKSWKEIKAMFDSKMDKLLEERNLEFERRKIRLPKTALINKTIRMIVDEKLPYLTVELGGEKTVDISGYLGEIWKTLAKFLKFKSLLLVQEIENERDSLLNDPDVDLILHPVVLRSSDLDDFDHIMPLAFTWYSLFIKVDPSNGNSEFYISIWKSHLWFAFFSTICLLTFSLWYISHVRKYLKFKENQLKNTKQSNEEIGLFVDITFTTCFLSILGTIFNQGVQFKSNGTSIRILLLVCVTFGLLSTTSYSAFLISKLTTQGTTSAESSALEAIKSKDTHSFCISEKSIAYKNFKINGTSEIQPAWRPIVNRYPCSVGSQDIVPAQDYCADKTIIFESVHNTNFIWNEEPGKCTIMKISERYFFSYITVLAQKGFPYKRILSSQLLKFYTSGVIARLQARWLPPRTERFFFDLEYQYKISFNHVRDIIFVYFCAILCSLGILAIEQVYYHRNIIFEKFQRKPKLTFNIEDLTEKRYYAN